MSIQVDPSIIYDSHNESHVLDASRSSRRSFFFGVIGKGAGTLSYGRGILHSPMLIVGVPSGPRVKSCLFIHVSEGAHTPT